MIASMRDTFIKVVVDPRASKEQINDMIMAFDAGAYTVMQAIVGLPVEDFKVNMDRLFDEVKTAAEGHLNGMG